jgi:LysM repeat protein
LFTYELCDYSAWANGLKSCGYATNPQYASVLIKCIENYDLHQWDLNDEERTKWFAQINKTDSVGGNDLQQAQANKDNVLESSGGQEQPRDRIYVFNDIKCVTLLRGESLNDLATKFEIGINRLMRYNDIAEQSQIQAGDRVYLQPKRHNGDENFHTVQIGETMFSMSRDHGIQLRELYEKNLMKEGDQPLQGEVVYLREKRLVPPKIQDTLNHDQMELVSTPVAENSPDQIHVVTKGDTLYSVAKKYNMTVAELKELNHLYSENLYVGERLKVMK